MRKIKIHPTATTDDYLKWFRNSPWKFRNDDEHAEAVKVLSRLLGRESRVLSDGERDYAEALAIFVREYDDRVHPFPRGKNIPLRRCGI